MNAHHAFSNNKYPACSSEAELYSDALKKIEEYGFDYFFFRIIPRLGNILLNSKVITNYPEKVIETCEKGYSTQKNPLVIHCQHSIMPIIWSREVFREAPELWNAKQTSGLTYGWSQSVHDANGMVSILSLARTSPALTVDEFSKKAANVLWLCNQLHGAMLERFQPRHQVRFPGPRLSTREIEVLKWTAEGKTASDIGTILNLTTRTANFHISSAIKKIGANNKTSAVVIAAKLGLL